MEDHDDAQEDADCDRDGLCLDFGDEGHFWGTDCGRGGPECPEGYGCVDDQCRPTSGQWTCNLFGADFGLTTECASTSPAGQCKGARQCSEAGLSACSAAVPVVEICNGLDDECNGTTDDCSDGDGSTANDACVRGTCVGTLT